MCSYLNGHKCLISYLLVLRDHASLGNKEFVFVFFEVLLTKSTRFSVEHGIFVFDFRIQIFSSFSYVNDSAPAY